MSGPAARTPGATGDAAGGDAADAVSPGGLEEGRQPLGPLIRTAIALTFLGAAAHLSGVIIRAIAVHRVPWGDMYEFVITLTCVAVLFFIAVMLRFRAWHLGLFVTGAVMVALGLAQTIIYTPAGPLVPALKSYWLAIHVAAMTLSTGIFFVAAVLGVIYLFAERHERQVAAGRQSADHGIFRRLPGSEALDRLTYRTVVFGFPIWTFGIICGAIWADQAWGRYWGWDPVETWAFITWVVYACFLHARATAGLAGQAGRLHPAPRVLLPAVQRAGGADLRHRPALLRRPGLTEGRLTGGPPFSLAASGQLVSRAAAGELG